MIKVKYYIDGKCYYQVWPIEIVKKVKGAFNLVIMDQEFVTCDIAQ